ncbi:crossover junction endodeoxyribonuclease RuvC, partial [Alistipes indistinctus]|uniref:crossover junction endodeoxyribonuclease RuvC n=1 Tax=Alistipes indistinctus TaxID=626932 RepID=UPI002494CC28
FGENVQSMLKLGRAQGVAMAAALSKGCPVAEYAPRRVKQAITGQGAASKEQVAAILKSMLKLEELPKRLDATDGLAVAVCHHFQCSVIARVDPSPLKKALGGGRTASKSWTEFISSHPDRVKGDK